MKLNSILNIISSPVVSLLALAVGIGASYLPYFELVAVADIVSSIFMKLLSLVSLPIIFLSIVSSATKSENEQMIRLTGKKIIKYTLLTTLLASVVALVVFLLVNPVKTIAINSAYEQVSFQEGSYIGYLLDAVPSNMFRPFIENNVIGTLFLALLVSIGSFGLSEEHKKPLHTLFGALNALFMRITAVIVKFIPLALCAFTILFMRDLRSGLQFATVGYYLASVMIANCIQAFIVLPLLLKAKGISPLKLAQAMYPALSVAFFTKSSNATVPMAVKSAIDRAGITPDVAKFTIPLCTTINMNACAAFILTTTLFVSMSYGVAYTPVQLVMWVFVATLAAVGNAGVPMGCYFLTSALLATMNVPLHIMGIILPFYSLIDAFETSINVWSDASCLAIVDGELKRESGLEVALNPVSVGS